MSIYSKYIDGLVNLIEKGRPDPLKDVICARLKGESRAVHDLVSPPLSQDEPDENAVFYYIYNKFESEKNERALLEMRRVVIELLMDSFAKREELFIIDALGQMAGVFQVKEFSQLAEQLRQQLWGYMCTRLGSPPEYKPLTRMMQLGRQDMEYAWRALDLWLVVTRPLPKDRDAHYYKYIRELFEKGLDSFFPSELRFHLLMLIFRALMKINPYCAAKTGFLKMCGKVDELDLIKPTNIYRHGWLGFCREIGAIFKYDEPTGKEWKKEFKTGLLEIEENINEKSLYWDSLKRMDGLDEEIKKAYTYRENIMKVVEYDRSEFPEAVFAGASQ